MSKLKEPENKNYAAVVVKINSTTKLDGLDNLVGLPLFGMQALVSKETQVGDVGLFFPAETQLSEEFAHHNNLHRHGNLNKDQGAKGYLEDNRRVKALKMRGHRSDALFMPLESLQFTKFPIETLEVGDVFDTINDISICKKFTLPSKSGPKAATMAAEKFTRVEKKFLPEHIDTDNYFRNKGSVSQDANIVVTQKLHGTSIRIGNTVVRRKLNWKDKLAQRLGVEVKEQELDYVFGSRKVIKDINNPNQNHFYTTDIWTEFGKSVEDKIPENFLVYGELIGYTKENSPIQKNYTYQIPERTAKLYVYRVATINGQGRVTDLSWEQVKQFCTEQGIDHVPELWSGRHSDFDVDKFIDVKYKEAGYDTALPLDNSSPVDEGICIRTEGLTPVLLKAKSPKFLQHETKMLDEEALDMEEEGK